MGRIRSLVSGCFAARARMRKNCEDVKMQRCKDLKFGVGVGDGVGVGVGESNVCGCGCGCGYGHGHGSLGTR